MTDQRQPPQDLAAERVVLGAMMLSPRAVIDAAEIVQAADFYRPAHATIFTALLALEERGEPTDAVAVGAELHRTGELLRCGGAPYLLECAAAVAVAANVAYYAELVVEKATLRRLVEAGTRVVQLGYHGENGAHADELVERSRACLDDIAAATRRGTSVREIGDLAEEALERYRSPAPPALPTGWADLDELLVGGLRPGTLTVVGARTGVGKALALGTPLATPAGWTTMGAVQAGERVLGADGRPTTVRAVTDVMHGRQCFEVHFSDGSILIADAEHQWLTETYASRRAPADESAPRTSPLARDQRHKRATGGVVTTEQIAATLRTHTGDRRLNHSVRVAAPLQLPDTDLPIPPYVLGVWLGDGDARNAAITSADPEIAEHIEATGIRAVKTPGPLRYRLGLPHVERDPRPCAFCGSPFTPRLAWVTTCSPTCAARSRTTGTRRPTNAPCPDCGRPSHGLRQCRHCRNEHGTVVARLRSLGVLNDKHIPTAYLRASEQQRRDLLAGLLDTDGTVRPGGRVAFAVTNQRLAEDAFELVVSLGYRATMSTKPVRGRHAHTSTCYTIGFTPSDKVFKLSRKLARQTTGSAARRSHRYITDVRPVDSVPVRCIEVDNADRLYLAGRTMIPTHNSVVTTNVATNVARAGVGSLIVSLEMPTAELSDRVMANVGGVNLTGITAARLSDDEWHRIEWANRRVRTWPLGIIDEPHLGLVGIRSHARDRMRTPRGLGLLVVDYLQLVAPADPRQTEQEQVSRNSRGLKLLAKELNIPVVAAAQINRGPEQRADNRPRLADLRSSGAIEQDADVVWLLYRDPAPGKEHEIEINVAKNRHGRTGTAHLSWAPHYSRAGAVSHLEAV